MKKTQVARAGLNGAQVTTPGQEAGYASTTAPPDDPTAAPTRASAGPRRPRVLLLGLAIAAVAAVAAAAVLGTQVRQGQQRELDEQAAVAAARTVAEGLTTTSPSTAAGDMTRLLEATTGGLRGQLASAQGPYAGAVAQQQISSKGTVIGAGLDGPIGDTARVLVAVTAQLGSPDGLDQQQQQLAVTVSHMPDGRWLASAVEPLS